MTLYFFLGLCLCVYVWLFTEARTVVLTLKVRDGGCGSLTFRIHLHIWSLGQAWVSFGLEPLSV